MKLYKEILDRLFSEGEIRITYTDFEGNVAEPVEFESFKALRKIKEIIADDSLDDKECYLKIDEIVRVFEELGSDSGGRHDF